MLIDVNAYMKLSVQSYRFELYKFCNPSFDRFKRFILI